MDRRPKRSLVRKDAGKKKGKYAFSPLAVDFTKLEMSSLKKYQSYFNIQAPVNVTKSQLISLIKKHFCVAPKLIEVQVISNFLYAIKLESGAAKPAAE